MVQLVVEMGEGGVVMGVGTTCYAAFFCELKNEIVCATCDADGSVLARCQFFYPMFQVGT